MAPRAFCDAYGVMEMFMFALFLPVKELPMVGLDHNFGQIRWFVDPLRPMAEVGINTL